MSSYLNSTHITLLENAISAASLRHKVITNNIANVNTPDFKRSEVEFEQVLSKALNPVAAKLPMKVTNEKHIGASIMKPASIAPQVRMINNNSMRVDGNNVDIDIEMANMAKNSIYYDAAVQQLNRHFSSIKSAINEGRR